MSPRPARTQRAQPRRARGLTRALRTCARTQESGKLSEVVGNAVQRWFAEASRAAKSGDANQMALLSQMLMEGYGCERDVERAQYWHMRSRQYGARRIDGVYDKIP